MSVKMVGASKSKGVIVSGGSGLFPKGKYVFEVKETKYTEKTEYDMHGFQHKFVVIEGPKRENGKSTEGKVYVWFNDMPMQSHPKYTREWYEERLDAEVALFNAVGITIEDDEIDIELLVGKTVVAYLDIRENYKTKKEENVITSFEVDKG